MYTIALAGSLGVVLTLKINDKFSKDKTYVNVLFCDDIAEMRNFHYFLTEYKIVHSVTDTYTKDLSQKTLTITAFAETKDDSKLIDRYVEDSKAKIKRVIQ